MIWIPNQRKAWIMNELNDLLNLLNKKETLSQLGKSVQAKPEQVQRLAQSAIPTLLEAINRNASTPSGAQSLNKALQQHQNKDLDNLMGFFNGVDTGDGSKIIGHVLGNKADSVENKLAQSTGLDVNQVADLLSQFGPLLLSFLGNQKKQSDSSTDGLSSGLGALLGGNNRGDLLGMASKFLDADGDGDVSDDLSTMLGGFLKK
jgi:hypothetical protein